MIRPRVGLGTRRLPGGGTATATIHAALDAGIHLFGWWTVTVTVYGFVGSLAPEALETVRK